MANNATNQQLSAPSNLNDATRAMVREWLSMHRGNVDGLARWMSRSLRIGGIKACRALVQEALS